MKRLVVIGADGMVSLAALCWLCDQDAAFVMLDRLGKVLAVTGPVSSSDARLRRAQALAHQSGVALRVTRELITQKLTGQEQVARNKLLDSTTADAIAQFRAEVATAESIATIRLLESQGAAAYWSAWRTLPINFPRNDLRRVPNHWRSFGARISPLTGSARRAANPVNSILNYLYALLESEARLAAAALGLDPGLGVLHVDTPARDSLALDLMEPVRPQVDAFVLDWNGARAKLWSRRSTPAGILTALARGAILITQQRSAFDESGYRPRQKLEIGNGRGQPRAHFEPTTKVPSPLLALTIARGTGNSAWLYRAALCPKEFFCRPFGASTPRS